MFKKRFLIIMRKYASFILIYLIIFSLIVRLIFFQDNSADLIIFIGPWYNFILHHGGFFALKYNFANYSSAYLFILSFTTYIHIYYVYAIKLISTIFDILLAYFVFKIINLKYKNIIFSLYAFVAVLLLPSVILNSALWGQCDSIYTSFIVGSLYFILVNKPKLVFLMFGLAFSFKLQSLYFFPVIIIYLVKHRDFVKYLLLIPITYICTTIPALLVGNNLFSIIRSSYGNQIISYPI